MAKWVNVIGSSNSRERVRRGTAQFFVSTGMAVWSSEKEITLTKSHPANVAARNRATFSVVCPPTEALVGNIKANRRPLQGGLCNGK
jgi:hypothetical protein